MFESEQRHNINKLLQKSKSPPDEFDHISKSISLIHVIQRVNYGLISYSSNAQYFFVKEVNLDL